MYFMQRAGDKPASKEQSPWICFTAVKLSTLWMSCSRGNNKRNSWSNYQVDKNALNFKKGSDKRHLQLSQAPGVRDWGSQQCSRPGCQAMATRVIETGNLKTLSLLQTRSLGSTTTAGAFLGRGERKRTREKKKKRPQNHGHYLPFTSNSHATPAKCCTYWFYQYYQKDGQMLFKK